MASYDKANREHRNRKSSRTAKLWLTGPGFAVFALGSMNVQAYLDPSTGSMVISAIVGIIASVALAVKTYWYRLKALFRRNPENDPPPD